MESLRAFTINSDSQFRAPSGLLGSRFGNTLMISTLDSFLFLHCGLAEAHLLTERAQAAAYIMCYLLIISEAGYFIGIEKSQLVPSKWTRFLGFICDSVRQAFLIPEDKKVKFAALREDILSSPFVGLKTLQRFSGKVISFSLAIP